MEAITSQKRFKFLRINLERIRFQIYELCCILPI